MSTTMIKAEHLTFGYGKNKQVFNDFNLEIEKGKIVGLLGKNGTGKSTLLYIICGLLKPSHGNVTIKGIDIRKRLPQTLSDIYLIPEEFDLPNLSMKQFVKLNSGFYPNFSNETLNTCLNDFDLGMDINLGELSMGQKKKAYMCFALATNTSLLLMDEPTNGLDIPSKSQFRKVIASGMTDEKTIIISTHQVRDIDRLLDHITIIDSTEVLLDKSVKEITDRLYFCEQSMNEPTDGTLFIQPSVKGNSIIMENRSDEESPMNLEVLFNAVLAERNKIQEILNK